jgi:hypothetical protein
MEHLDWAVCLHAEAKRDLEREMICEQPALHAIQQVTPCFKIRK